MKVSYQWIQDYVKTSLKPAALEEKFRLTSSEVDSVENFGSKFVGLIVGKVLNVEKHPNADRLRCTQVSIGTEIISIVCGAPNVQVGINVVVALPGVTIYPLKGQPVTITVSTIRGEQSHGMLCAAEEIGLPIAQSEDGLLVLPSEIKPGTPLSRALNLDDTVIDLEITPNRPDLLSYYGLAREISAFEKKSLLQIPISSLTEENILPPMPLAITLESASLSPRYSAICLDNITVEPSPLWLQLNLIKGGIRPINNVVDITNYVMLELGQPLHAFDLDALLAGNTNLAVAKAEAGEKLITLDGVDRSLPADALIIQAGTTTIDLVGIMGGMSSSIQPSTTKIMFQAATFSGPSIRRTSRALGLRTEASGRYEKGLDSEQTITALKRAVYLLQSISNATVSSQLLDLYPKSRQERNRIHLSFARIQQLLGVHISAVETKAILQKLGFQLPVFTKSSFEAIAPSWRKDVQLPEDIIEELVRIWSLERLPITLPSGEIKAPQPNRAFEFKNKLRHRLAALGLYETIHQPFIGTAELNKVQINPETTLRLPDPFNQESQYLLPDHLITFLTTLSTANNRFTELALFEIGHIFYLPFQEKETLSLIWRSDKEIESLYRQAKMTLNAIAHIFQLGKSFSLVDQKEEASVYLKSNSSFSIEVGSEKVGEIGEIASSVINAYKIRSGRHIVYVNMDMKKLLELPPSHTSYAPLSQYPAIERDITLIIPRALPFQTVDETIEASLDKNLVASWNVKDIYHGKPLEENDKSITLHFVYQVFDRTLADHEVNADMHRLSTICEEKLSARLTI